MHIVPPEEELLEEELEEVFCIPPLELDELEDELDELLDEELDEELDEVFCIPPLELDDELLELDVIPPLEELEDEELTSQQLLMHDL